MWFEAAPPSIATVVALRDSARIEGRCCGSLDRGAGFEVSTQSDVEVDKGYVASPGLLFGLASFDEELAASSRSIQLALERTRDLVFVEGQGGSMIGNKSASVVLAPSRAAQLKR
jgi:hypothetical protein